MRVARRGPPSYPKRPSHLLKRCIRLGRPKSSQEIGPVCFLYWRSVVEQTTRTGHQYIPAPYQLPKYKVKHDLRVDWRVIHVELIAVNVIQLSQVCTCVCLQSIEIVALRSYHMAWRWYYQAKCVYIFQICHYMNIEKKAPYQSIGIGEVLTRSMLYFSMVISDTGIWYKAAIMVSCSSHTFMPHKLYMGNT